MSLEMINGLGVADVGCVDLPGSSRTISGCIEQDVDRSRDRLVDARNGFIRGGQEPFRVHCYPLARVTMSGSNMVHNIRPCRGIAHGTMVP